MQKDFCNSIGHEETHAPLKFRKEEQKATDAVQRTELFDHLIGGGKELWWYIESECLCGPEING